MTWKKAGWNVQSSRTEKEAGMTAETRPARRHWKPQEIETLQHEWRPGENNDFLAAKLGRSRNSIKGKAGNLGLTRRRGFRLWTAQEDEQLRELVGRMPDHQVARKMGRSVNAVRVRTQRLGVSWRDRDGWYTAQEAGEIMGVDSHWIASRIREGTLTATRKQGDEPRGGRQAVIWRIERKALREFLRRYPHELTGRNVDLVQIVEILAGLRT